MSKSVEGTSVITGPKCNKGPIRNNILNPSVIKVPSVITRLWAGGRDEVWDRETMFSQLAKRSPRVVVSGKLQYFSHSKYF